MKDGYPTRGLFRSQELRQTQIVDRLSCFAIELPKGARAPGTFRTEQHNAARHRGLVHTRTSHYSTLLDTRSIRRDGRQQGHGGAPAGWCERGRIREDPRGDEGRALPEEEDRRAEEGGEEVLSLRWPVVWIQAKGSRARP